MDYVDGALSAEQRSEFDRHLKACPSCVAYLDSYRRTVALGKDAASDPASSAVPEELVEAIRRARRQ